MRVNKVSVILLFLWPSEGLEVKWQVFKPNHGASYLVYLCLPNCERFYLECINKTIIALEGNALIISAIVYLYKYNFRQGKKLAWLSYSLSLAFALKLKHNSMLMCSKLFPTLRYHQTMMMYCQRLTVSIEQNFTVFSYNNTFYYIIIMSIGQFFLFSWLSSMSACYLSIQHF